MPSDKHDETKKYKFFMDMRAQRTEQEAIGAHDPNILDPLLDLF